MVVQMFSRKGNKYLALWWNGIKSFPETTSIHGFRFIGDSKRHLIERFLWLFFVCLSWYCSSLLIAAQYNAYINNPISFVVETTYTNWTTKFPSIVVCETESYASIQEISNRLWGKDHDFNIEEVLKELSYFKGAAYYTTEFCNIEDPLPECFQHNITHYVNLVRGDCNSIISFCTWNGQPFECCSYFRPMDTELGICYAINSIQGRERRPPKLELVNNRTTGPGTMTFKVLLPGKVYVLNEEEVPSITTPESDVINVKPESYYRRLISIKDIHNDAGARLISPVKRKCRYTDENNIEVYPYYSYTACTVQCRKDAQLRMCNCTNFYMPNVEEHLKCNMTGVICLYNNLNTLSVLKARWSSRTGLFCDCLPSCTEAEISTVKDFESDKYNASVAIELAFLPTERYRRNVVRGALDLVVSTGGTGGLFLGTTILSFVELIYIILIRPFCNIYTQRYKDPWHEKYGRKLEDNKFIQLRLKRESLKL